VGWGLQSSLRAKTGPGGEGERREEESEDRKKMKTKDPLRSVCERVHQPGLMGK
jgi:hypothetical protein